MARCPYHAKHITCPVDCREAFAVASACRVLIPGDKMPPSTAAKMAAYVFTVTSTQAVGRGVHAAYALDIPVSLQKSRRLEICER